MSSPSEFSLPLPLAEGLILSGIQLECLGCARPFRLTHGSGCASPVPARIALAASAACPACAHAIHFLIVVDAVQGSARVQRVSRAGVWVMQRLIRLRTPLKGGPARATPALPERAAQSLSLVDLELAPESLGRFRDVDIPAWIALDGERYAFAGVSEHRGLDSQQGPEGLIVIPPGLLYRPPVDVLV